MKKVFLMSLLFFLTLGLFISCNSDTVDKLFTQKEQPENLTEKFVRMYQDRWYTNILCIVDGKIKKGVGSYSKFKIGDTSEYLLSVMYDNKSGQAVPRNVIESYFVFDNKVYGGSYNNESDACTDSENMLKKLKGEAGFENYKSIADETSVASLESLEEDSLVFGTFTYVMFPLGVEPELEQ